MSVLYPPIQEEMRIRRNIALGPSGLGQYFSVFPSPLGLGGTIRTLCTWSCPPQARAIKLRIALVLVEWSHAGGGEINIDLGQYWLLAAWLACIPLQRTHQELYSVPIAADKQLLATVVNQLSRLTIINYEISKNVYKKSEKSMKYYNCIRVK